MPMRCLAVSCASEVGWAEVKRTEGSLTLFCPYADRDRVRGVLTCQAAVELPARPLPSSTTIRAGTQARTFVRYICTRACTHNIVRSGYAALDHTFLHRGTEMAHFDASLF